MSLNVVFTGEDRAAIKFMRHSKGYNAGRLVKEIPLKKNRKIGGLNKLPKKFDDADNDIKHFVFTSQVL